MDWPQRFIDTGCCHSDVEIKADVDAQLVSHDKLRGQFLQTGDESQRGASGKGPGPVLRRPQGAERAGDQHPRCLQQKSNKLLCVKRYAAKYTPEGEGWTIKPDVIAGACAKFSEALFEAVIIQTDERVGCPDSYLTARMSPGN